MSRVHISFVTPVAINAPRAEIVSASRRAIEVHGLNGLELEESVARMGGKILSVPSPEISLEVFGLSDFTIYNGQMTSFLFDRFAAAVALGHYVLHFPRVYTLPKTCGLQVIKSAEHPDATSRQAVFEAMWFATELLMPEQAFRDNFASGGVDRVCTVLSVSRGHAETRAKGLGMMVPEPMV